MSFVRIAFIALLVAAPSSAQVIGARQASRSDQWTFGVAAYGGIPVGEFRQHENGGGGGEIVVGYQPWRRQPAVLRGQFGALLYGSASAEGYQDVCDEDGTNCFTELVSYRARNHTMMFLQGGPEFMATDGTWRPFGYALAGWTFFNSWANPKRTTPSGPDPESVHLFSSRNFSTTYGVGLRRVGEGGGRASGFEFGARVTRNAKARYLTEDGVYRLPNGQYAVMPRNGAANVLLIHVGWYVGPRVGWWER